MFHIYRISVLPSFAVIHCRVDGCIIVIANKDDWEPLNAEKMKLLLRIELLLLCITELKISHIITKEIILKNRLNETNGWITLILLNLR